MISSDPHLGVQVVPTIRPKGLGTLLTAQRAHNPECRERIGKLLETDDKGSVRLEEHDLRRKKRRQADADAEASAEQAGGAAQEAATPAAEAPTMMEEEATDPATPPARQQQAGSSATTQGDHCLLYTSPSPRD